MSGKKRGLGRGLDALLGGSKQSEPESRLQVQRLQAQRM